MQIKTIRDLNVEGKKVLLRVDYNVPFSASGEIEDKTRILETLPTLGFLLEHQASILVLSHLGRPKGKPDPKFSLRNIAALLEGLLHRPVKFAGDCIGPEAEKEAKELKPGEILMLENLRFHKEEEENDPLFGKLLAFLGDLFVNDAFSVSHRAHASIFRIPEWKPAVAGFLLEKELKVLSGLLLEPRSPYFALLGGAKVSDKLRVIQNLLRFVDRVFIGGAMAFTFLKSQGLDVGKSLVEDSFLNAAADLLKKNSEKIVLPVDCMAVPSLQSPGEAGNVEFSKGSHEMAGLQGVDLGPKSILKFTKLLQEEKPKTVFWNGPMGVFEVPPFSKGTLEMAKTLGQLACAGSQVVIGGGDSVAAVNQLGLAKEMTHISTGGGASLEFLEGKTLPGIAALSAASASNA